MYLTFLLFCSCIERTTRRIRWTRSSPPSFAEGLDKGRNKDICRYPGSVDRGTGEGFRKPKGRDEQEI